MLEIYKKQFDDILNSTKGRKQTLLLSNLMTQMESYYNLSMIKEIFESETAPAVRELYLAISNARQF